MDKTKITIQTILEAPVAGHENIGDFDKSSSFRKPIDRKLVSDPAMVKRVANAFKAVNQDVYFYFVNSPKANQHTEVGEVSLEWVQKNLDEELYDKLSADMNKEWADSNGLFIVFTNNKGSEWRPMTPWIMAHRVGHALSRYRNGAGLQYQFLEYTELVEMIGRMAVDLLDAGYDIDFDPSSIKSFDRSKRRHQLIFKGFCQQHMTFKSARDRKVRDYFEIFNELIAQKMITDSTPIKTVPEPFKVGNTIYNPKMNISDSDLDDFRQLSEMYARDISDYAIEGLLSSAIGKILVM